MRKLKKRQIVFMGIGCFLLFLWLNNTNLFINKTGDYKLLAHRGLAQTFDISKVEWNTNTAKVIYEPEHEYLENTLDSMQIAFDYGADVVELDVQRTKDGQLAVFHDYDLAMRTDGIGKVSEYTMAELKKRDIGYGYTADQGTTFPFRGKGDGLMPALKEVFAAFPDKEFLIHLKDGDLETAKILWTYLEDMPSERLTQITVYGGQEEMMYLREQRADIRILSMKLLKETALKYIALGWTGYIPKEMHHTELHIPLKFAKVFWGWPHKFIQRMESVNTRVVIVDGNGKWSEGFDSLASLEAIPKGFKGYVWTNRIDLVSEEGNGMK